MVRLQARLSAKQGRPRAAAIARAPEKEEKAATMDNASYGRSRLVAGSPLPSSSISFGMTLVMAIACGVAAANIYYNQPMLGIMEAAFPGQVTVIGLVPTATQLGFAAGLLLVVPLGDRFDRRRLILIQLAGLTCRWPPLLSLLTLGHSWLHRHLWEGRQAWRSRSCLLRPSWPSPAVAVRPSAS